MDARLPPIPLLRSAVPRSPTPSSSAARVASSRLLLADSQAAVTGSRALIERSRALTRLRQPGA